MSEPARWAQWLKPENALALILLGLMAWMPFPYGSDRTWAELVSAAVLGGVLLAWAGLVMSNLTPQTPHIRALGWPALCMGAAFAWGAFQTVDLVVLERATGLSLGSWAHPTWFLADEALGSGASAHISVAPDRTMQALLGASLPVIAFLSAFNLCRDRQRANMLVVGLVAIAAAFATLSAAEHIFHFDMHAWILSEAPAATQAIAGPFVHPDHLAGYLAFAALAAFGMFAERFRAAGIWDKGAVDAFRASATSLSGTDGVWLIAGSCLLAIMVLTQSGTAMAAFAAGLLVLALALAQGPVADESEARGQRVVTAILVAVMGIAAIAGAKAIKDSFGPREVSSSHRQSVAFSTMDAIGSSPWRGHGLGAFEAYYPAHARIPAAGKVDAAGNSGLEVLADLGLPAGLAWLAGPVLLAALCLSGAAVRRRDRAFPAIALATCMCAAVLAVTGFGLQIPAIAVTLAVLLGIGTAQSWPTNMDMVR